MNTRFFAFVAAAMLGAASLVFIGGRRLAPWRPSSTIETAPFRIVQGRIAGMPFRPLRSPGGVRPDELLRQRAHAAAFVRKTSDARLRGDALLLIGHTGAAVDLLRRAAGKGDPLAWSDLAVALIERGTSTGASELLLDAVAASNEAIALDDTNAAAHFNAAVALEELGLTAEAAREYNNAARLESGSEWSAEALRRARQLAVSDPTTEWRAIESQLRDGPVPRLALDAVARESGTARRVGEWNYLAAWGAAHLTGNNDAAQEHLTLARTVAAALVTSYQERLLADSVVAIDRAASPDKVRELAKAHVAYDEGRKLLRGRDAARALEKLGEAASAFQRAGSPMSLLAKYYASGAFYSQGRIDAALETVAEIEQTNPELHNYRALAAQLGWHHGICLIVRGRYTDAVRVFDRSRALALQLRDALLTAQFDSLAAEALEYLGQTTEAWRLRRRALRSLSAHAQDQRKTVTLMTAANLQLALRQWRRCAVILDHAVPIAVRLKDPVLVTHTLAQRAIAREELGDQAAAAADRHRAAIWLQKIAEPAVYQRLAVELEIARGIAIRTTSPRAAVSHFDNAIHEFATNGERAHLPRLYYERGRAYEALGRLHDYQSDLHTALEVIDSWADPIEDLDKRAALNIWSDTIRRDALDLALRTGDVATAFAHAERRRSPDPSLQLPVVMKALRGDAAIVEFAHSPRGMVAFVIRHHETRAVLLQAPDEVIASAAESFRQSGEKAATELERLLVAPIRHLLRDAETLLIVPERELTGIPFGALYNEASRRLLIEEFAVVHALRASEAVAASQKSVPTTSDRVLVIGANTFASSDVEPLPHVDHEIKLVSNAWPQETLLAGTAVTTAALRRALANFTVIHYAGHIVGEAAGSQLLLSDGTLALKDIARLDLSQTRVVVLAACRGVATRTSHSILSDAASAFLLAGAQTVIASAVDVDDSKSAATMARLHSFLAKGHDPADAVRRTMLAERHGLYDKHSEQLMVIGGSRNFVATR